MATLLRRLTGFIPKRPTTYTRPLRYQEQKDVEHTAALSSLVNGANTLWPNEKLLKFQHLVGIQSSRTVIPGRPAPSPGIYKRTVDEEAKAHSGYVLTTFIVNYFFLLQIILGAGLTALGAAGGPSVAITVLGATNTIIAGILTYLKGQGLPARLEQSHNLLRTLREHIEERERELTEPGSQLDVDEVVQSIVQMYKEVRQIAEDNAPGNVVAPKGAIASLIKNPQVGNQVPTAEGIGGTRLKEARSMVKEATPATRSRPEDTRAVTSNTERAVESRGDKGYKE